MTEVTSTATKNFASLAAMRARHRDLLSSGSDRGMTSERRKSIQEFLKSGSQTGAVLQQRADRSAAQSLLDYWVGVLVSTSSLSDRNAGRINLEDESVQKKLEDESAQIKLDDEPTEKQLEETIHKKKVEGEFFLDDDFILVRFDPTLAPDLSDKPCPYNGLAVFREQDSYRFYGREEAVKALTKKVLEQSIVIVTGSSGSGKSSLAIAGLLPALKASTADTSGGWNYLPVVVPGNDPIGALLRTLCPSDLDPRSWSGNHRQEIIAAPDALGNMIGLSTNDQVSLLVVDQFEELFTLCTQEYERYAYAAALVGLTNGGKNRLVLTVREDFLHQTAQLPAFKGITDNPEALFVPPAMTARELRRVIEKPAELVGLIFDEGIVDDLVKEVAGEPTALPLLQFTLMRLWESKDRNRIGWDTYRRVGSPREALKRTADEVYQQLPQELDRQVIRLIFHDLVQPSVGVEFVRRRVRRETLRRLASSTTVDLVLERFASAGLIRITSGQDTDDDRFEVAHEALIRNWPMLATWMEAKRRQSEKEIQLATTARLWKESGSKGYLLTGDALSDAVRYADASMDISELVRASQAEEFVVNSRARKRLMIAVAVLTVGCLTLGMLARVAWYQAQIATKARDDAKSAKDDADQLRAKAESEKDAAIRLANDLNETVRDLVSRSQLAESALLLVSNPDVQEAATTNKSPEMAQALKVLTDFNSAHGQRTGYSATFLGTEKPIPLPKLSNKLQELAYDDGKPLNYIHYSVVLHQKRKMAIYSAANMNRAQREIVQRKNTPWKLDRRVDSLVQADDTLYKYNDLDRGLLSRRLSVSWGADAELANEDAFYFTNTCPMHRELNQRAYSALDEWFLDKFMPDAQRIILFGGPVFRQDDFLYRGFQLPRTYWRLVVARDPKGGRLVAQAYRLEHYRPGSSGDEPEYIGYVSGSFEPRMFQISVDQLEQLTSLDFGIIRDADALKGLE